MRVDFDKNGFEGCLLLFYVVFEMLNLLKYFSKSTVFFEQQSLFESKFIPFYNKLNHCVPFLPKCFFLSTLSF